MLRIYNWFKFQYSVLYGEFENEKKGNIFFEKWTDLDHSVLERIWVKGSYLSQWLPQGERGPPKESKSG